jgi:hypothetical protein
MPVTGMYLCGQYIKWTSQILGSAVSKQYIASCLSVGNKITELKYRTVCTVGKYIILLLLSSLYN